MPIASAASETTRPFERARSRGTTSAYIGSVGIVEGLFSDDRRTIGISSAPPIPAFVGMVERFCHLNLARPIGVEDMARVARMSRFHFSRLFKKARGVSPGRYLAKIRLDMAMRLLTSTDLTLEEIAGPCGFGDANYLCKVFRISCGVSPGRFRVLGVGLRSDHKPRRQ